MTAAGWCALILILLVVFGLLCRALLDNPRQDVETGLFWHTARLYTRLMHRVRIRGAEHIPTGIHPGPLIVVANHSSGVDPVLIQAACPFEVRWIMAADMRHPLGESLWTWGRIIFVGHDGGAAAGTREALRHLRDGGVLGIFPEGGIERPPRHIRPFLPGVGYIIKRSGAPVLPILVDGTPATDPAWDALCRRSRSVLTVMPPIDYRTSELDASCIAEDLRRRFLDWSGWPSLDAPLIEEPPAAVPFPRTQAPPRRVAGA
jgi:1-acyl-sn-glycerol-3-phosphate acyltransferase